MNHGIQESIGATEELMKISDYENLLKRIEWSEKLNLLLSLGVLFIAFSAIVAIGMHTDRYERRLQNAVKEFEADVLALTGDQNIAIRELSKLVLDRDWVNYQRLSLKQLQHFCELRDHDPKQTRAASPKRKNGLGGN